MLSLMSIGGVSVRAESSEQRVLRHGMKIQIFIFALFLKIERNFEGVNIFFGITY